MPRAATVGAIDKAGEAVRSVTLDSPHDLARLLKRLGCRSASIHICECLHAKVYIFESKKHDLVTFIGSHNPTTAGSNTNLEVGVCFNARVATSAWRVVADLKDFLRDRSRPYSEITEQKDFRGASTCLP